MRKLKIQGRHAKANSVKGQERVIQILNAARDLFLESGYAGLSMRKVAQRAGISVGNLSYYYRTKPDLIQDLMSAVVQGYFVEFDNITNNPSLSPEDKFKGVVHFVMEDIATSETSKFFPEIWALSNYDSVISEAMEDIYRKVMSVFAKLVEQLNDRLSNADCAKVALFIMASLEGHTIFVGFEKSKKKWIKVATNIALFSLLTTVRDITVEDIASGPLRPFFQKLNV